MKKQVKKQAVKKKAAAKNQPVKKQVNPQLLKLGLRIRALRIKKGYTSAEYFAYDHGFNRAQFGRYEAGTDDPRYTTLVKIAEAFGLTLEEFFKEKV